jgi:hypothetical protein
LRTFRQNNLRQVYVQTKPYRDDVLRDTPAVLSAGGIDEGLVQAMFPYSDVEFASANLAPGNYYLEQCADKSFSTSSLLNAGRKPARTAGAPRRRDETLGRLAREIAVYERFSGTEPPILRRHFAATQHRMAGRMPVIQRPWKAVLF